MYKSNHARKFDNFLFYNVHTHTELNNKKFQKLYFFKKKKILNNENEDQNLINFLFNYNLKVLEKISDQNLTNFLFNYNLEENYYNNYYIEENYYNNYYLKKYYYDTLEENYYDNYYLKKSYYNTFRDYLLKNKFPTYKTDFNYNLKEDYYDNYYLEKNYYNTFRDYLLKNKFPEYNNLKKKNYNLYVKKKLTPERLNLNSFLYNYNYEFFKYIFKKLYVLDKDTHDTYASLQVDFSSVDFSFLKRYTKSKNKFFKKIYKNEKKKKRNKLQTNNFYSLRNLFMDQMTLENLIFLVWRESIYGLLNEKYLPNFYFLDQKKTSKELVDFTHDKKKTTQELEHTWDLEYYKQQSEDKRFKDFTFWKFNFFNYDYLNREIEGSGSDKTAFYNKTIKNNYFINKRFRKFKIQLNL
jgi:hypothetical protein